MKKAEHADVKEGEWMRVFVTIWCLRSLASIAQVVVDKPRSVTLYGRCQPALEQSFFWNDLVPLVSGTLSLCSCILAELAFPVTALCFLP